MRALAAATMGGGVVVFFESEALPVYGLVDLRELPRYREDFGLVVVVDRVERLHELVVEEAEPRGVLRAHRAASLLPVLAPDRDPLTIV